MNILLFVLGTIIASFCNALMYRIEKGFPIKKMLFTRSQCENCKKELEWYELVPILSWVFQGGKCTGCKASVEWYYPLSEALLGLGFVVMFNETLTPLFTIPFLVLLFLLSYSDYVSKGIPQNLTNVLVSLGFIYFLYSHNSIYSILVLIGMFLFYLFLGLLKNEWKNSVGFGDLLLLLFFAFVLPIDQFVSFLLISTYSAVIFAIIMIVMKKGTLKTRLPLVPFMTLSYIITPLLSQYIIGMFL